MSPLRPVLLARLTATIDGGVASPYFCVRAREAHHLKSVTFDRPTLSLLLRGRKRAGHAGAWLDVGAGEMFLVSRAASMDVQNVPDAGGKYLGVGIPLTDAVLAAARQLAPVTTDGERRSPACVGIDDYCEDLLQWLDATEHGDAARADLAVVGVVLRLYAQGFRSLLRPVAPTLSARIRDMVTSEPAHAWPSARLEAAFALSGATLRRRLAAEGSTLRELIAEARLSHALILLLSTGLPVKTVAARAGYASVSSFIARFRARYGVDPSRVGSG